jgi:peptidoglycan/LPS O-acetylase OafA/YrhL
MHATKKIFFLDALRGIFCLVVILYHLNEVLDSILINNFIVKNGLIVVDFFFLISGFVISYNYSNKISSLENLLKFQLKRFIRLYPLHLVMLGIFSLVEIIKLFFYIRTGITPNHLIFSTNNIETFIINIFLLQGFILNSTFNTPSWSISQEFYIYFIYGLTAYFVKDKKKIFVIFFLILVSSYFFMQKYELQKETNIYGSIRCIFCFFLGASLSIIKKNMRTSINIFFSNIINLLILSLIFLSIFNELYLPTVLLFAIFIITNLCSKRNIILDILNKKVFIFLGSISYGIYMIHFLVIYITIQSMRFYIYNSQKNLIFKQIEIKNYISVLEGNFLLAFIIVTTIILSYLSKIYLESYFKFIGNKIDFKK